MFVNKKLKNEIEKLKIEVETFKKQKSTVQNENQLNRLHENSVLSRLMDSVEKIQKRERERVEKEFKAELKKAEESSGNIKEILVLIHPDFKYLKPETEYKFICFDYIPTKYIMTDSVSQFEIKVLQEETSEDLKNIPEE